VAHTNYTFCCSVGDVAPHDARATDLLHLSEDGVHEAGLAAFDGPNHNRKSSTFEREIEVGECWRGCLFLPLEICVLHRDLRRLVLCRLVLGGASCLSSSKEI
jgi:hypothetical protein